MGSWGSKPFENDTALDFWADLRRSGDATTFSLTFHDALARPDGYFDVTDAEAVIAAGELVAAGLGHEGTDLPDGALVWAVGHRHDLGGEIRELARLAVRRVHSKAPLLMDSWFSHEGAVAWLATVEDLAKRLELAGPQPGVAEE